jgi:hypothetical protein
MPFVELPPFAKFCEHYWTDEELAAFQRFSLATPDAGSLMAGPAAFERCVGFRWGAGSEAALG